MKKILFSLALCLLTCLFFCGVKVSAKTVNLIEPGKSVSVDIDKDGKKETIQVVSEEIMKNGLDDGTLTKVSIDGKLVASKSSICYYNVKLVQCGDRYFLNLENVECNDIVENCLLYSVNTKHEIKKIIDFSVAEHTGSVITAGTKNSITINSNLNSLSLSTVSWRTKYKVSGDKVTLSKRCYQFSYTQKKGGVFTTNIPIKLTTKIGEKKYIKVSANKKVKLIQIIVKNKNFYGKFKYGKKTGYLNIETYTAKHRFKGLRYAA